MLSELLKKKSLFFLLYTIDKEIAEQYRSKRCPYCGGPLYYANYLRKPRGEPEGVPEECFILFSLCCGTEGCRCRVTPPSCRFLGRKVYWFVVILITAVDWQNNTEESSIFKLSKQLGISRNTLKRWFTFFRETFPRSQPWQRVRGQVPASVKNEALPSSLINHFLKVKSCAEEAVISCLKFLSLGADICSKIRDG
ncbi:MAG: hypothetical protein HQK65_18450 [Desulfamplus sp.]|nr:hypothetical protein [Desulfamplus sp.]